MKWISGGAALLALVGCISPNNPPDRQTTQLCDGLATPSERFLCKEQHASRAPSETISNDKRNKAGRYVPVRCEAEPNNCQY